MQSHCLSNAVRPSRVGVSWSRVDSAAGDATRGGGAGGREVERGDHFVFFSSTFASHLLRFVLYRSALAHSLIRSYARSNLAQRDVVRVLLD